MTEPKPPPPWLFALTNIPYGVVGGFSGIVMPYLSRRAGLEVGEIGWYITLLLLPPVLLFLYTPIVDFGPKRKHWLVIVSVLGAACLVAACVTPIKEHLTLFLAFAFAGQTISGLVGSCNGGLLATTMPDARRGSASGWLSAGNQCGAAVSSSVALYMTGHDWPPLTIGLVLAAMMIIPSLAVLVIVEPVREVQRASAAFKATISDVRKVLFSKRGITGILLCMSPVGTAALINYFSAIGIDYVAPGMDPSSASITVIQTVLLQDFETARMTAASVLADEPTTNLLALLTGPLGAAVIAIGSVGGGYLCDRFNRRAMYLTAGVLVAIVGIAMALSPRSETTLIWGALTYQLVMGFAFTAFYAVVLESIGKGGTAAATQYSLFVAAGNAAIAYVGLIDSQFHENHGVEGVVASDSALNIAGVIVLGLVFWYMGFFKRKPKDPDPEPVPAGT